VWVAATRHSAISLSPTASTGSSTRSMSEKAPERPRRSAVSSSLEDTSITGDQPVTSSV
jgi:hypothetical protein